MSDATPPDLEELNSKIDLLRQKFNQLYAEQISTEVYDEQDLERLREDDGYARCFLRHQKGSIDKAVSMVDTSLRWRKEMALSELTERTFPREMHEIGAVYYHNQDKKGRKILYFQVSKNKKDAEKLQAVKRFVAWWIDKHFLKQPEEKIVVLFDMTDAGMSNMDIDLIKFQIYCFTAYYPALLEYMLIYEMPFILNAIWKVIKNILSAEQQKAVLFVKRSEIQQYISPDMLWAHMGGTDTYQYSYIPSDDSGIDIPNGDNQTDADSASSGSSNSSKKKVTFSEKDQTSIYSSLDLENEEPDTKKEKESKKKAVGSPKPKDVFLGAFAAVSPAETLPFLLTDELKETGAQLKITNTHTDPIAFKVKTTSPDGYRVRPSTGIIHSNTTAEISIFLQPSHKNNMSRDKFLIMVLKIGAKVPSQSKLVDLWRAPKDPSNYMEHRLWCTTRQGGTTEDGKMEDDVRRAVADLRDKMSSLIDQNQRLEKRLSRMFIYQLVIGLLILIVLVAMALCYGFYGNSGHPIYTASTCAPFTKQQ